MTGNLFLAPIFQPGGKHRRRPAVVKHVRPRLHASIEFQGPPQLWGSRMLRNLRSREAQIRPLLDKWQTCALTAISPGPLVGDSSSLHLEYRVRQLGHCVQSYTGILDAASAVALASSITELELSFTCLLVALESELKQSVVPCLRRKGRKRRWRVLAPHAPDQQTSCHGIGHGSSAVPLQERVPISVSKDDNELP